MPEGTLGAVTSRVLIADSDADRRAILGETIRRLDPEAQVVEVTSGSDLVRLILEHSPSLAFVGVRLRDLSGPEAVATARKQGGQIGCLVLVTARVLPQWQELALNLGAYEVLKTPLDTDHIGNLLQAEARRRQPTRVVLASSSEAGRGMVGRVLARSGFALAVDETDCGRHALKLLKRGGYDLAFVDLKLNGIDGLELACQLQPSALSTRLTLMTTGEVEPIAQAGRFFGVDAVLRMPFYARDIDLALHHALGLRRPYLLNAITAPPAPTALLRISDFVPHRHIA